MSWFFKQNKKRKNLQRGFSLLELIVVITIFLIITAVVIADIPNFQRKSALELVSSEVATYIRGAQVYGASQKSANAEIIYGIHLDSNNFFLFQDQKSGKVENYDIKGFSIGEILIKNNEGALPEQSSVSSIDVVFSTSNYASTIGTKLEPEIYTNYPYGKRDFSTIDIKVIDKRDSNSYKFVRIYNNGQIAVVGSGQ